MNKKSFTLIELLVVIAIIGILSSLVIARFSDWGDNARIANTLQWSAGVHRTLGANLVGHWPLNGDANDISGYNNHGTLEGSPIWVNGVLGTDDIALQFDGNNNYISVGSLKLLNQNKITVTAWVKGVSDERGSLFGFGTEPGNTQNIYFWGQSYGESFGFNTWNTDSWGFINSTDTGEIMDGEWHHLVAIFDRVNIKDSEIFVDGVSKNISQVLGITLDRNISNNFGIGYNGWNSDNQKYGGILSNVYMYDIALTTEEVSRIYVETKDKYLVYE